MTRDELRTIETYCSKDDCGDPVAGGWASKTPRTKRKMTFAGYWNWIYAKYYCPSCGGERLFRSSFGGGHYLQVTTRAARTEVNTVGWLVIVVLVVVLAKDSLQTYSARRAAKSAASEMEALVTLAQEFRSRFAIAAEGARVVASREIEVTVAARLRDDVSPDETVFLPETGYFLDQDGTRYEGEVRLVDGTPPVPGTYGLVTIVPGQTYRYLLVAPIPERRIDPTSDDPASWRSGVPVSWKLTKLVLHLEGSSPMEVPLGPGQR
jgi:hypothetical protein